MKNSLQRNHAWRIVPKQTEVNQWRNSEFLREILIRLTSKINNVQVVKYSIKTQSPTKGATNTPLPHLNQSERLTKDCLNVNKITKQ